MDQAEASAHVQFVYDVAAGRVVFVNAAFELVLHGRRARVNEELPSLLLRLDPDDRTYLAHYWKLWVRGQMPDEVEIRLQDPAHPNQPAQWFCLTPYCQRIGAGGLIVAGTLRDISAPKHYQENADTFNTRKNATLEILSHDLSGAFVMVQQIVHFLQEEVHAPAESRVTEMLRVLETTS